MVETIDHLVPVRSQVPVMEGRTGELYLRERVKREAVQSGSDLEGRVVLFVHGAGTPAEVAFDVPHEDYSWMAYLGEEGFDVFAVDMTGYGRSTRPAPMADPCNVPSQQQESLIPAALPAPCEPSYAYRLTTIASDWNDIDAAVEYIRELRGVERVSLIGWSLGGPRAGGYAARHPEKVARLVLLAPAYSRAAVAEPPAPLPVEGFPMTLQGRAAFVANWDRQAPCADQYDPAVSEVVWAEMLASDPVGAGWADGYRRAPQTTTWGWDRTVVSRSGTPTLVVSPVHDGQIPPDRVREFYEDLGATNKVLVDLACSSHNAMWERNHHLMFQASLEWLTAGTVEGQSAGIIRLGYEE